MACNVFLGLGSNVGDRIKFINDAADAINRDEKCRLIKSASYYETTPYGNVKQQNFINTVFLVETEFNLLDLFNFLKKIETKLGRKKESLRWGPREIDVDILFYNNLIYNSDKLSIPHKEILQRDFVIVPLIEIAPDFIHPVLNKRLDEIDLGGIEKHIIRKLN
ncbi:MAG: 2-amino-4-hydroxy-6-hydroxymethyldihydropteridine diphosphokinase [Ignavibacteriales bacterium]|nr:2-amino-4-hydroxy-6-hydroxymethyldihydropteridine diphosphokinase [Ignavibacteriales bacterium]